jgi:UDP-N-acetylmuramoyl-L-alanyl-D-glutamate--2,6-diaminopimelate ligase
MSLGWNTIPAGWKETLCFCVSGSRVDGRQFAHDAMARGAVAVVSELPRPEGSRGSNAPWIEVEHGRQALAIAARNFYARPDEHVAFTGITGTNGKTTTAYPDRRDPATPAASPR